MAVTHQRPCPSQVGDTDLIPAKIKMDLLSAFDHFSICAKNQLIFKCLLCCSLITAWSHAVKSYVAFWEGGFSDQNVAGYQLGFQGWMQHFFRLLSIICSSVRGLEK